TGTDVGTVYAIDPATGVSTLLGTTLGQVNSLAFGADGTLYLTTYAALGALRTLSPAGLFANVATGLSYPSSIEYDALNQRLLVFAEISGNGTLYGIDPDNGAKMTLSSGHTFIAGWATTSMLTDGVHVVGVVDGDNISLLLP
ncbi:MAG: hypothetical protein JRH20_19025, partial [Deltaproteobacteria bacterium]|nr:hypothetical protein [Deltaproteobacteria bacterium]